MDRALAEAVNGFLFNRSEQERTGKARDRYRDALRSWLMTEGREDENGHRYLDLDGSGLTIGDHTYRAICAQRRVTSSIDLDATEDLCRELGLFNEVFPVVPVRQFDEDALYAANQRGLITDEQLDSLITENVTYAIVPVKS